MLSKCFVAISNSWILLLIQFRCLFVACDFRLSFFRKWNNFNFVIVSNSIAQVSVCSDILIVFADLWIITLNSITVCSKWSIWCAFMIEIYFWKKKLFQFSKCNFLPLTTGTHLRPQFNQTNDFFHNLQRKCLNVQLWKKRYRA